MNNPTLQQSIAFFGLKSLKGVSVDSLKGMYHDLAQKYHPDRGGSSEEFIYLRNCYNRLKRALLDNEFEQEVHSEQEQETQYNKDAHIASLQEHIQNLKIAYDKLLSIVDTYETTFNRQIRIINDANSKANMTIDMYNQAKKDLRVQLDQKLEYLKKQYNPGFWAGMLSRNTLSYEDYISINNQYVDEYNQKSQELDSTYLSQLVNHYQNSMSRIIDIMEI